MAKKEKKTREEYLKEMEAEPKRIGDTFRTVAERLKIPKSRWQEIRYGKKDEQRSETED